MLPRTVALTVGSCLFGIAHAFSAPPPDDPSFSIILNGDDGSELQMAWSVREIAIHGATSAPVMPNRGEGSRGGVRITDITVFVPREGADQLDRHAGPDHEVRRDLAEVIYTMAADRRQWAALTAELPCLEGGDPSCALRSGELYAAAVAAHRVGPGAISPDLLEETLTADLLTLNVDEGAFVIDRLGYINTDELWK